MACNVLRANSHNVITLDELKDEITDAYVNDATVTGRVQDLTGSDISGETWPITMAYVATSNGKYQGTFANTAALSIGTSYLVVVVATTTGGTVRTFRERAVAIGTDA